MFAIIALIISKGWCITRVDLAFSEWREIFILSLVFFVLVTLMQVIGNSWNFTDNVWIAVIILYSCLYFFILGNTWRELDLLYAQVAKIHDDRVVNAVTVAVREKFTIFLIILVMIAAMFTAEVLCNYMFSSRNRLVFVYIVYELVSLLVILTIGYFIRPRNLSPFYFVIPVTTNLNTHLRTIANDPMLSTAVNSTK